MISRVFVVGASVLGVACSGSDAQTPMPGVANGGVPGVAATSGAAAGGAAPATTPVATGTGAPPAGTAPDGAGTTTPSQGSGGTPSVVMPPPGAGGTMAVGGAPAAGGAPSAAAGASGAAGAAGAGGSAPAMDPPGTATISTDPFMVQPGQEVFKCQNFKNPFAGKDTAIQTLSSQLAKGSHHLHLYNLTEGTSYSLEDCSGSDFHSLLYNTGRPVDQMPYPVGMAAKLRGNTGLRVQLHFLNTTTDQLTATSTVKMIPVADPSTVTKWVASIYLNRIGLTVPPGMQTINTSCSIPSAYGQIGLVRGVSHMHSRGIHFVAKTSTGTTLIDDTTWDEPPPHFYDPPIMMNPGDSLDWTCTYQNDTGMTLTFGNSAATNEMCIFTGRYYSSDTNDVQIVCMAGSDNGGTAQLESN